MCVPLSRGGRHIFRQALAASRVRCRRRHRGLPEALRQSGSDVARLPGEQGCKAARVQPLATLGRRQRTEHAGADDAGHGVASEAIEAGIAAERLGQPVAAAVAQREADQGVALADHGRLPGAAEIAGKTSEGRWVDRVEHAREMGGAAGRGGLGGETAEHARHERPDGARGEVGLKAQRLGDPGHHFRAQML